MLKSKMEDTDKFPTQKVIPQIYYPICTDPLPPEQIIEPKQIIHSLNKILVLTHELLEPYLTYLFEGERLFYPSDNLKVNQLFVQNWPKIRDVEIPSSIAPFLSLYSNLNRYKQNCYVPTSFYDAIIDMVEATDDQMDFIDAEDFNGFLKKNQINTTVQEYHEWLAIIGQQTKDSEKFMGWDVRLNFKQNAHLQFYVAPNKNLKLFRINQKLPEQDRWYESKISFNGKSIRSFWIEQQDGYFFKYKGFNRKLTQVLYSRLSSRPPHGVYRAEVGYKFTNKKKGTSFVSKNHGHRWLSIDDTNLINSSIKYFLASLQKFK